MIPCLIQYRGRRKVERRWYDMAAFQYRTSNKYTDYDTIYANTSGPGCLELAEFMARKMGLAAGKKLLDVGANRGYQTIFLAKEYGVFCVGIDPWNDRMDGNPRVDHLQENGTAMAGRRLRAGHKDWGSGDAFCCSLLRLCVFDDCT
jgi:cyclopropane fatty-acyl-phospholipid synthase-like methyltransferase